MCLICKIQQAIDAHAASTGEEVPLLEILTSLNVCKIAGAYNSSDVRKKDAIYMREILMKATTDAQAWFVERLRHQPDQDATSSFAPPISVMMH